MVENCIGCGREIEDDKLAELQDVSLQSTRMEIQVGDKVRLTSDWGIVEKGKIGVVSRMDEDTVEIAFNYQTPFDLEQLKEHGSLSVSGGPIKKVEIKDLDRSTEIQKTSIHKSSPTGVGETPSVTIYSQVWELGKGEDQ